MWREFMQSYTSRVHFAEPASKEQIREVETAIGVAFPDQLRSLLLETDGVTVTDDDFAEGETVWGFRLIYSLEEIYRTHVDFRKFDQEPYPDYPAKPISPYLFCASMPNGDYVGFYRAQDQTIEAQMFCMSHEDYNERTPVADGLKDYIATFLRGFVEATS